MYPKVEINNAIKKVISLKGKDYMIQLHLSLINF